MSEKNVVVIEKITKEFGLVPSEAEKILSSFSEVSKNLVDLNKKFSEFGFENEKITREVCAGAKQLRLQYGKIRISGDKTHKKIKADALLRCRAIDGVRNIYKLEITERENKLKKIETHFENIEKEEKDKIEGIRRLELSQYCEDAELDTYDLRNMTEELFVLLLKEKKNIHFEKIKEEKEQEEREKEIAKQNNLATKRRNEIKYDFQFLENKDLKFGAISSEEWEKVKIEIAKKKAIFEEEQKENERRKAEIEEEREKRAEAEEKVAEGERARKEREEQAKRNEKNQKYLDFLSKNNCSIEKIKSGEFSQKIEGGKITLYEKIDEIIL